MRMTYTKLGTEIRISLGGTEIEHLCSRWTFSLKILLVVLYYDVCYDLPLFYASYYWDRECTQAFGNV